MIKVVENKWENVIEDAGYILDNVFGVCQEMLELYIQRSNTGCREYNRSKSIAAQEIMEMLENHFGVRYEKNG